MCTLYTLIGSGVVKSISALLPVNRKQGNSFHTFATFNVEFENDIPASVFISLKEIDFDEFRSFNHPYFEPLKVETRLYNPNIDRLMNCS